MTALKTQSKIWAECHSKTALILAGCLLSGLLARRFAYIFRAHESLAPCIIRIQCPCNELIQREAILIGNFTTVEPSIQARTNNGLLQCVRLKCTSSDSETHHFVIAALRELGVCLIRDIASQIDDV
jgi:hypothetical protein